MFLAFVPPEGVLDMIRDVTLVTLVILPRPLSLADVVHGRVIKLDLVLSLTALQVVVVDIVEILHVVLQSVQL